MENKIVFEKTRGVAETVNTSLEFIKNNLKVLFRNIFFIAGPAILLSSLLLGLFQASARTFTSRVSRPVPGSTDPFLSGFINFGMAGIGFSMVSFFLVIAVVYKFLQMYRNTDNVSFDVKNIWKEIGKDWWFMLKTCIGLLFVSVFSFILLWLCMFAVIYVFTRSGIYSLGTEFAGLLMVIMACLMVVVILYVLSPLTLVFNIRVFERKRFFSSVKRAYALVNGKRWKTVGIVLVCIIIQAMISLVFYIPTIASFLLNQFILTKFNLAWLTIVFYVLLLIMGYFINIVSIVSMNFHYFSIVEEKEATGLLTRISLMGQNDATPTANE